MPLVKVVLICTLVILVMYAVPALARGVGDASSDATLHGKNAVIVTMTAYAIPMLLGKPAPIEDLSNIPSDLNVRLAYVVNPEGSGTFSLQFADSSNASRVKVYKITDSEWTGIEDVVITGNAVEFTIVYGLILFML